MLPNTPLTRNVCVPPKGTPAAEGSTIIGGGVGVELDEGSGALVGTGADEGTGAGDPTGAGAATGAGDATGAGGVC